MSAALTAEDWKTKRDGLSYRNQAFIDGKFVDSLSGDTFECISPLDGKVLTSIASCNEADVDLAVTAARKSFESGVWSRVDPVKRKKTLLRLADLINKHADELALLETLDMGKPVGFSKSVDVAGTADCFAWYAEAIDKLYDEIAPTAANQLAMIRREPMGVVAAITPWNFPMLMSSWKLAPALAMGNSVILKPAKLSSLTALRIAELGAEAGLPDGVLNVITGSGGSAGRALGLHMDVDAVVFTGSTAVGKTIMGYAAESNLKPVALECGGKSPHIVFADANLKRAARAVCTGAFFNQGEQCSSGTRLLVEESVRDEFVAMVIAEAKKIAPGDPLNPDSFMGAMVDEGQTNTVMNYISIGKEGGAELLLGGNQVMQETGGYYIEPTIFGNVTNDMRIAQEEIFGPVLSTISFTDAEDAVRIANDSIYGLASGVWTQDITKAHSVSGAIRAGTVWVNCYDAVAITTPFGGYKQSGFGRDRSLHAIDKYTQIKTLWMKVG